MMLWGHLKDYCNAHCISRMFCRVSTLTLLIWCILPQCIASNFRTWTISGVYLTRDGQLVRSLGEHNQGTYWIDGYQMSVTKQTQICWHDAPLQFGSVLGSYVQPIPELDKSSACEIEPLSAMGERVWLQYIGVQEYLDVFRPDMKVVPTRIDVWKSERNENHGGVPDTTATPAWQTLCSSTSPHQLLYPNEGPIDVVCDANVNSYIGSVFSALLKPSTLETDAQITKREMPRFYVVKPFKVRHNYDFEIIDGSLSEPDLRGEFFYKNPHAGSIVRQIVYTSDRTVLVPDTVLAHLGNEAELAALMSYSHAITEQQLIQRLFSVQHFKAQKMSFNTRENGTNNAMYTGKYIWNLNEQVLRLGIRQLYQAGYDIRYAPFSWAVAKGKKVRNPQIDSNDNGYSTRMVAYAFNYISQYYKDVDYSKLKRGEAEYAQFLDELRKADPDAFEVKK